MSITKAHYYAIDAASLLETCLSRLRETIALDRRKRHEALVNMQDVLVTTERLLLAYVCKQIDMERESASNDEHLYEEDPVPPTLLEGIETFQTVLEAKKQRQKHAREHRPSRKSSVLHGNDVNVSLAGDFRPSVGQISREKRSAISLQQNKNGNKIPAFEQSRSPVDSLLFQLIVALQLCLVRIDDAHLVIAGHRYRENNESLPESLLSSLKVRMVSTACVLGIGSLWMLRSKSSESLCTTAHTRTILGLSGKVALVAFTGKILVREWGNVWMRTKIVKSTADVKEWQHQWLLIQRAGGRSRSFTSLEKSQRLIEYAMSQSPKVSLSYDCREVIASPMPVLISQS